MPGFWCITVMACSVITYAAAGGGTLETIDGVLIAVVDNCTPGDNSTCPAGHCYVKVGLGYPPETTGPKPAYMIACKPYRKQGEFCYRGNLHEYCPCDPSLHCNSNGMFGHCV